LDPLETAGWKSRLSWAGAVPLAALFLVSGLWKVTGPMGWAVRIDGLRVPHEYSLAAALAAGIAETVGAVWILAPRFRRWGAMLIGLLLVAFMAWFALQYGNLRGADCSCFPWVKRVVGPGFFIGDTLMLLLAVIAAWWSRPPSRLRSAAPNEGVAVVFALVSYGVAEARQSGARAPERITVAGQPYSIERGRVFVFFFNPECLHCLAAARRMAQAKWGETRVVAVPVEQPQYAEQFLASSGLPAVISTDFEKLKQAFHYSTYPYGVAVENGRTKTPVSNFDGEEPIATLKTLGFVE
jgi:uncharacterized membrane protein YphA (DoxX/SURF4 family)